MPQMVNMYTLLAPTKWSFFPVSKIQRTNYLTVARLITFWPTNAAAVYITNR